MHEYGFQRAQVLTGIETAFLVHVGEGVQRLVNVAGRRILAVEDREVLDVVRFGPVLAAETHHRFTEVHDAIVGCGAGSDEVHDRELGVLFQQHRHGACALGGLAARAPRIFRDVGADHDRLAARAVQRQVPDGPFHAIDATEAGVLELGDFAAARDRRHAARFEGLVDHALDDDRAGRIVGARFGAETQELDARGIDVVLVDQAHDGRCRHRVDAVVGSAHAETAPDDFLHLGPVTAGPLAPVLEPDAIGRHIGGKA